MKNCGKSTTGTGQRKSEWTRISLQKGRRRRRRRRHGWGLPGRRRSLRRNSRWGTIYSSLYTWVLVPRYTRGPVLRYGWLSVVVRSGRLHRESGRSEVLVCLHSYLTYNGSRW